MFVVFTKSIWPASWLIRKITREDCSHVALVKGFEVLHCNFTGVHKIDIEDFLKENTVVHAVQITQDIDLDAVAAKYAHARYDFGAMLYLGLRFMCRLLPKANLWQTSGMFLCTEFVTEVVEGKEDSDITPYKLFLELDQKVAGTSV